MEVMFERRKVDCNKRTVSGAMIISNQSLWYAWDTRIFSEL